MGNINYGRVVIGGIAAAVVFFGLDMLGMQILGFDMQAWMTQHNLTEPSPAAGIVGYVLLGLLAAWLYAAIRPRFGPGVKTAIIAAIWLWLFFVSVYWGFTVMGLFSMDMFWLFAGWGLLQTIIAVLVAAWLYKEAGTATA